MGCGGSNGASEPGDEKFKDKDYEADEEWLNEHGRKRKQYNKKTGAAEDYNPGEDRENDFFEGADAGSGEQFMSVLPYKGAIKEPADHPDVNDDPPSENYSLEYVYGYRAEDSRMNCFYNKDGNVTYMTAAVGVILDKGSNTQKFFGGGQADNTDKHKARDDQGHTNDITAMDVSSCRGLAATGQNGSRPVAFVWDSTTGDKKARFKLDKGMREVTAIGICPENKYVALADNHNDHHVWIFEVDSGSKCKKEKSGPDRIYHISWSKKSGESCVATAGAKHFAVWDMNASKFKKSKGIHGGNGKPTSHCAVTWDDQGTCYTGGANSHIYVWEGRNLQRTYDVHGRGFVCAIRWCDGKIVSGAKDGNVVVSDPASGSAERTIDVGCLVRSVDMHGGDILAGLRDGTVLEINSSDSTTELMKSHSSGEAWGLAMAGNDHFVSSGDDDKIISWSIDDRKWVKVAGVCDESAKPKKGKASTLSDLAPSKCARAVAVNSGGNSHVAIGHNDGRVTIRGGATDLDNVLHTLTDSDEWIETMTYSADGSKLAVGSHDNNIYVYNTDDYKLHGTAKAHNSFIVSVDWSEDGTFLRSVCGAHELLFFTCTDDGVEQDPDGASNTVETVWQTSSNKYGWLVSGIFPAATDGTHINGVSHSSDNSLIATADDYGLVNVWRNPARKGCKPISLRGHSEHVVRALFTRGTDYIISIGGYDKTIMQWKKN